MSKSSWPMSEQLNQVQTRPLNYKFVSLMITCFLNHCFWDSLLYNVGALKNWHTEDTKGLLLRKGKGLGKSISLKKTMLCEPTHSAQSGGKDGLSAHLKQPERDLIEIII